METKITNLAKKNDLTGLAKYLLFNTHLIVNGISYRMLEIELYVCNDKHYDVFAHQHKEQKNMLTWYFHQMSDKEHSYKGGNYKGLDITCANSSTEINKASYSGILIRAILNEKTDQVIEGPCKVVNEILSKTKCESIKDLVIKKLNNELGCQKNDLLKLELKQYGKEEIYVAPRIGLSMKGDEANVIEKKKWIDKKYRFIVMKDKIKKEKKKMELLE